MNNPTFPEINSDPEADVNSDNEDMEVGDNVNSDEDTELGDAANVADDEVDDDEVDDDEVDDDVDAEVDVDADIDAEVKDSVDSTQKQLSMLNLNADATALDDELSSVGELTDTDTDTDEDSDENAFKKLDIDIQSDFIKKNHPEAFADSHETVEMMTLIKRNKDGMIDDPNHKTHPFMSRYEITHILGLRAKQIEHGAPPLITPPSNIIDGYQIARLELQQKKVPFIIKRPLPGNKYEYWHSRDLEILRDI